MAALASQRMRVSTVARAASVRSAASARVQRPLRRFEVLATAATIEAPVKVTVPTPVSVNGKAVQVQSAIPVTQQEIVEVAAQFDRWNSALQTGIPEKVAECYADDAILLPTVSNKPRTNFAERVDYFTAFTKLRPFGTIDQPFIRFLADGVAINSGIYTFDLVKDGVPAQVQARYTFLYKKIDGDWKIVEHHSSALPEVSTRAAEVAALFDKWNAALQTGDAEKVADLYAANAVLLPTVSNKPRINRELRVDYFKQFLQLKPFGTIDQANIRFLNNTTAINSGIYTFQLTKDGKKSSVQARYSFVYQKRGENWLIVEHHSSAMPEA
jgi:uncharacterized protein (TIGR02246 family)